MDALFSTSSNFVSLSLKDLIEARTLIERWRRFYNEQRPHSSIGYRTPAQARKQWHVEARMQHGLTA